MNADGKIILEVDLLAEDMVAPCPYVQEWMTPWEVREIRLAYREALARIRRTAETSVHLRDLLICGKEHLPTFNGLGGLITHGYALEGEFSIRRLADLVQAANHRNDLMASIIEPMLRTKVPE